MAFERFRAAKDRAMDWVLKKLSINGESWHARLYLRAYVTDRASWRGLSFDERTALGTRFNKEHNALFAALEGARQKCYCDYTSEAKLAYKQAQADYDAVYSPWMEAEIAKAIEAHAQDVKTRFYAGQISLCPYFHSVWIAALMLWVVLPMKRAAFSIISRVFGWSSETVSNFFGWVFSHIGNFLSAHRSGIFKTLRVSFVIAAVIMVLVNLGSIYNGAASVCTGVASAAIWVVEIPERYEIERQQDLDREWSAELARERTRKFYAQRNLEWARQQEAEERWREERKRRREEEQLAWEKANPGEAALVRRAKAEREANHARWARYRKSEREIHETMLAVRSEVSFRENLLTAVKVVAGGCVLTLMFCWLFILFRYAWLAQVNTHRGRSQLKHLSWVWSWTGYPVYVLIVAVVVMIDFCLETAYKFVADTFVLVAAFAASMYRGVCPFIQFTDRNGNPLKQVNGDA